MHSKLASQPNKQNEKSKFAPKLWCVVCDHDDGIDETRFMKGLNHKSISEIQ